MQVIPIAKKRTAFWMASVLIVALVSAFAVTVAAHHKDDHTGGNGGPDNQGTIKVHDNEDADPDVRNEPHVSCDFWIEGFNMEGSEGYIVFYGWPPTGDKDEVEADGDSQDWEGEAEEDQSGGFHFENGPFFLPDGHYRVEVFSTVGDDDDHFEKAKMFWVDPCEQECEVDCEPPPECPEVDLTASAGDEGILVEVDAEGTFNLYRAEEGGDFEFVTTFEDEYLDDEVENGVTYDYVVTLFDEETEQESEICARASATAIPFFPSLAVGALALIGAVGMYTTMRKRS